MAQNRPKMEVTEHFGAILGHFEDFVSVWELPWAAKACGAVKMGVSEHCGAILSHVNPLLTVFQPS